MIATPPDDTEEVSGNVGPDHRAVSAGRTTPAPTSTPVLLPRIESRILVVREQV
jgi:hypothetical protein